MKQAIELDINEPANFDFTNEEFKEMNKYNEFLLSKSLSKFTSNNTGINLIQNPHGERGGGAGSCPFLNKKCFRDIETRFIPHYEMKDLIYYPYEFFFDLINYKTNDLVNKSKKIRALPKFIRNTLFLNDESIKKVRKMNFSQSFIVGEQLKESTEKIYKEGNYYEALQQYILIYSLFRWLEFKDKNKENTLLKDVTKIAEMPIIDDDIILKRCAVNDPEKRRKSKIQIPTTASIDNSISYDDEENLNEKEDEVDKIEENDDEESSEGEEEEDDENDDEDENKKNNNKEQMKENNNKNKNIENVNKEKNDKNNNNKPINRENKIKIEQKIENKNKIEEEKNAEDDEMEEMYKYDKINFNKTMQLILKRMGYCYIHLCSFSEAIECFNEAFKYVDDECPDFYFRRAQAKIYNKLSTLKDLKSALGDLNKALSRKITFHSEIILREHKFVQELINKKEEQISLVPIKLLNNFRFAMNKIKKNNLNIQDYIINNNEMDETNYLVMKEVKEIYYFSIKQILKKKNQKLFEEKIKEYDDYLDKFYLYEEYYTFDVNKINLEIYQKLTTQQKVDIQLLKQSKTLRDLLNELKYRKCEEIYDNLNVRENIFLQAHKNVMEIKRIEQGIKNLNEEQNLQNTKGLNYLWNWISNLRLVKNIGNAMKENFYFLSISLVVLCITIFASQLNPDNNSTKK